MTGKELNSPYPNGTNYRWEHIAGNTYEHFREHGEIIQRWLAEQRTGTEAE